MTKEEFISTKKIEVLIVTLSDKAKKGQYEDLGEAKIKNWLTDYFISNGFKYNTKTILSADDPNHLEVLLSQAKENKLDIVFTVGGTGVGIMDFTPEIAKKNIDKEIPGIMENIRIKIAQNNPNALLSRSIAGIMGKTQLYCLPGDVSVINDYMKEILKTLEHLLFMVNEVVIH